MGDPAHHQGFSDPDLTQDKGGRIYNTGINLATDSFFSTNGGKTWDNGTAQCHKGDRPWLAGSTDIGRHRLAGDERELGRPPHLRDHDGGNTCNGTPVSGGVATPAATARCTTTRSSTSRRAHQRRRRPAGSPADAAFEKRPAINKGPNFAHWPSIAIDRPARLLRVGHRPGGTAGGGRVPEHADRRRANTARPRPTRSSTPTQGRRAHWSKVITVSPVPSRATSSSGPGSPRATRAASTSSGTRPIGPSTSIVRRRDQHQDDDDHERRQRPRRSHRDAAGGDPLRHGLPGRHDLRRDR